MAKKDEVGGLMYGWDEMKEKEGYRTVHIGGIGLEWDCGNEAAHSILFHRYM